MPLLHDRVTMQTYSEIIDKVHRRMTGWKRECLSYAGRVALIKLVISAIPCYAIQTSLWPNSVVEEIERCARRFLCEEEEGYRKLHQVTKSKEGLGIWRLEVANRAFSAELGWRMVKHNTALWAQVLRSKYIRNKSTNMGNLKGRKSHVWKSIIEGRKVLKRRLKWGGNQILDRSAQDKGWKEVWKQKGQGRWQFHLWIAWKQRLLTNAEKRRRHTREDSKCQICGKKTETTLHVLRDCEWINKI